MIKPFGFRHRYGSGPSFEKLHPQPVGQAVRLSFSMAPEVRPVPGSLDNIFRAMHADLGHPRPANGDLTPRTRQGVPLLNTAPDWRLP